MQPFVKNVILWVFQTQIAQYRRGVLRGYTKLKANNSLGIILDIKDEIERELSHNYSFRMSRFLAPSTREITGNVCRQNIIKYVGGVALHKNIQNALSNGSTAFHILPPQLLDLVKKRNIPVNNIASILAWSGFVILFWLYGVAGITYKLLTPSFKNTGNSSNMKATYFFGLNTSHIPTPVSSQPQLNLVSWYIDSMATSRNIRQIFHECRSVPHSRYNGVSINYQRNSVLKITSLSGYIAYALWALGAIVISLYYLIIGRWWAAFLLVEASSFKLFELNTNKNPDNEYWFHHESFFYRPMWTYLAQQVGGHVSMYFYSTNNHPIVPRTQPYREMNYWKMMKWPSYVVWDNPQKKFIENNAQGDYDILVVDDLPFSDNGEPLPVLTSKAVVIFDVPPKRHYQVAAVPQLHEYVNKKNYRNFLKDVIYAAKQNNLTVLIKTKKYQLKDQKHLHHLMAEIIEIYDKIIFIDPGISAHRVIEHSDLCVSFPYTSTGIIAKNAGKPVCYYDAESIIEDALNDRGIPVYSDASSLTEWMKQST